MILALEGSKSTVISQDDDLSQFRVGISSRLHGTYLESGIRGNAFSVNASGRTLANITSTTPAFGLYNFADSGRYLSLIRWELVVTTAPLTPVIGTYCLGVISMNTGQDTAQGQGARPIDNTLSTRPDSRCTSYLATFTLPSSPTIYRPFVQHFTGGITSRVADASYVMEFNGTCLIAPGRVIVLGQLNVDGTNATVDTLAVWEEVEI